MDSYLINDYMEKQSKISPREKTADQRRKARAIDLFEKGIGVEEIAEIIEVSVDKVREYLGKTRLESINNSKNKPKAKKATKAKASRRSELIENKEQAPNDGRKLSKGEVDKLTVERNERIRQLYDEGLTLQEVAEMVKLTPDQAKEIYLTLGLSIYTPEELRNMRQEEDERKEAEKKEKAKERRRRRDRERRARIKAEKEKEKQAKASEEAEQEDEEEIEDKIESFQDIGREMSKLIKQGHSKKAADLGDYYMEHADFLTNQEREKLFAMVDFIKVLKREYKEQRRDGEDR